MNHKRVERLWRREGLKVPAKQPKRKRLWLADGSCVRLRPAYRDHIWSYDFVQDRTSDGRPLKMLTLIDEHSRECLAIDVARSLRRQDVLERLSDLFVRRGAPEYLRSDGRRGVYGEPRPRAVGGSRREDVVHRAGQPLGKRLHRKF